MGDQRDRSSKLRDFGISLKQPNTSKNERCLTWSGKMKRENPVVVTDTLLKAAADTGGAILLI